MAKTEGAGGGNVGLYVLVGLIALVTLGIVVFVGFGGSDSSDAGDAVATDDTGDADATDGASDASTTTVAVDEAAVPEGSGDCSAVEYPGGELEAQGGLNEAVAATRRQIALAAAACDYAALQSVMGTGFVWGFAPGQTGTTGAINDWKTREGAGEPVLLDLLEIISLEFAVASDGTYTFPAASQWKAPAWAAATPEDLAALESIYGKPNVDRWRGGASFDGYRVGIRENGLWYYFAGNQL
jgi:hypothetical protein